MAHFSELIDVAAERFGSAVIWANDEFFAPKEALLKPTRAEWREGEYTERGKWMDGWETRRRRTPGYDWCIVRLGLPAVVRGVVVDTSFFRGNYPEHCSIEGCELEGTPRAERVATDPAIQWTELLPRAPLRGDSLNEFPVERAQRSTHLRLNIYPDGGVARLRVFGEGRPDPRVLRRGVSLDLAAAENGGFVVSCSDMFFGHRHNLIMPGRSTHMGDGWETKRRRGPGHDWSVIRLAARGVISHIEIDTDHYKGNAPESFTLESADAPGDDALDEARDGGRWRVLVPRTPLEPHSRHRVDELAHAEPATHVRLSIFPDGGIARLRLIGTLAAD